jgi:DNA polymerase-3 subunit epsilon
MPIYLFRRNRTYPDFVRDYLEAPRPDLSLPWRAASYTALDVETSGLDPRRDAVLAIGLVEIESGRVLLERAWRTLVRPPAGLIVPAESIRIHGLLRRDLADAPPLSEALPELLRRLRGRVLLLHVAAIDAGFLNQVLRRQYAARLRGPVIDTARLAAKLQHDERYMRGDSAGPPVIALRALAERAGLPAYAEHNPLDDALTTAQLFLIMATQLERQGRASLGRLLRLGGYLR